MSPPAATDPHCASATPAGSPPPNPSRTASPTPLWSNWRAWLAGLFALLHVALALGGVWHKAATFDEVAYLAAGWAHWQYNDHRLTACNAPTPHLLAGAQFGIKRLELPGGRAQPVWQNSQAYGVGQILLYSSPASAENLLRHGRLLMAMASGALCWLIWRCSTAAWGAAGGWLSLALAVFCPTLLAHGPLMTSDLLLSLFLTAATYFWWRTLQRITVCRVTGLALAVAGLLTTKLSGLLFLPMAGLSFLLQRPGPEGWLAEWRGRTWAWRTWPARLAAMVSIFGICLVVFWAVVWTQHGFRYSIFAPGLEEGSQLLLPWEKVQPANRLVAGLAATARQHRLLPEAYLWGTLTILSETRARSAFLHGQYSNTGWWQFFPTAFAIKTPLALFFLFGLTAYALWRKGRRRGLDMPPREILLRASPWLVLLAVYWPVSIASHLNIGHRHILPTYPALYILAGAVGLVWSQPWWRRSAIALAGCWALSSLSVWPHSLAFFNMLVGGPANGWRWLSDSSLDWGQEASNVKAWIKARSGPSAKRPVYLSYFGLGRPDYYGADAYPLPGFGNYQPMGGYPERLEGGDYLIGASILTGPYLPSFPGPWNAGWEKIWQTLRRWDLARRAGTEKFRSDYYEMFQRARLGRLVHYLRHRPAGPDGHIGYAILHFRLSNDEVEKALSDTPPFPWQEAPEAAFQPKKQP